MSAVSIILPVKDEPNLNNLVREIHNVISEVPHEVVIVYGDKSRTKPSVDEAIIVKIYGDSLERAILSGISFSKHENVVVMDADGSHPPEVIPKLIKELENVDLVIASRFMKGGTAGHMSPYRRFVGRTFKKIAGMLGVTVSDPMSGFFAFKKHVLEGVQFKPFKWKVLFEILVKKGKDLTIKEIPYTFRKRSFGASKTSIKTGLIILTDMLSMSKKLKTTARLLLTVGLLTFTAYFLDLNSLLYTLLNINPVFLVLSMSIYMIMTTTMALRIYYVFRKIDVQISFKDVFWSHTFGMLMANMSPAGKAGYLSSVPLLSHSSNFEQKRVLSFLLGIQSIELLVKAFIASVSIFFFLYSSNIAFCVISKSLLPAIIGTLAIVFLGTVGIYILRSKPYWLEDTPILGDVAGCLNTLPNFKQLSWQIALISVICWLLRGLEWYFIGLSVGRSLPLLIYLVMHPLLTAIKFIPLTPSSLGIFEMTVMWGMVSVGFTPETSFMFAMLDRFDNIFDVLSIKEIWRTKK